jgi:hypothetical protein
MRTLTLTAFVVGGAAILVALLVVGQAIDDMALGALLGLSAAIPLALLAAMSMDRNDPDAPDRPRVVVVQPARPALPMPARQRTSRRDRVAAVFAGHRVSAEVQTQDGIRFEVVSRNGQDVAGFVRSHRGEFGLALHDDDAVIVVDSEVIE